MKVIRLIWYYFLIYYLMHKEMLSCMDSIIIGYKHVVFLFNKGLWYMWDTYVMLYRLLILTLCFYFSSACNFAMLICPWNFEIASDTVMDVLRVLCMFLLSSRQITLWCRRVTQLFTKVLHLLLHFTAMHHNFAVKIYYNIQLLI
jgi:hypothetical protein